MPVNKMYKFARLEEMQYFLNGAAISGDCLASRGWVSGLVGKTLVIGATTVTFVAGTVPADGDTTGLYFKDIKTQIETAVATVKVYSVAGKIVIQEATPTSGVTVTSAGTGNALLGFNTAASTVGKFYTHSSITGAAVPMWMEVQYSDATHVLYTWE